MSANKEKSCGAILCKIEDGDIYTLVIRHNAGHWGFPKGHSEENETERETAIREVEEETGIKIRFVNGFREETHYSPRPGVYKDVVYFIGEPTGGKEQVQEEEVSEMRWVRLYDAAALLTYDNDSQLLKKAVRFLKINDTEGLFEI
ncbi:MAG: NUDIX domain-containing protein [Solobacterium sp.]|nr:NUDIX domain-containing protein [Solobacterium sp.]